MSYYDIYNKYKSLSLDETFQSITSFDVEAAIESESQDAKQLLALLSPAAESYLEQMAQKAHELTVRHFGKTIQLYTPIYLSDHCENQCSYCGFNVQNNFTRKKLSLEEVEKEAAFISSTGLRHILVLTGDSREKSPPEYIKSCIKILKKYFTSISIEIYALTESEYAEMVEEGVDGLTIYQETYDEKVYERVHKAGPKRDYLFRLDAPERAAKRGMRNVNIGVLLGLTDWRKDIFFTGLHAQYLQDNFYDMDIAASIPRLRPHAGDFKTDDGVTDKNITQIIVALRIFMPRLGISLSTRESSGLRQNLLPLGITRMSASSSTRVGGHTSGSLKKTDLTQFEISDKVSVDDIKKILDSKGYQAVLKDWIRI